MCEWALMMPGMMVLPVRSITCAPAGGLTFAAGPMAAMRPPEIDDGRRREGARRRCRQ